MSIFCVSIKKLQMQCERLRDQDIMHSACRHYSDVHLWAVPL